MFKIGDKVKIVSLTSRGKKLSGVIGHIGTIDDISNGFYYLKPYCTGSCWPEECLELVSNEYNYRLF